MRRSNKLYEGAAIIKNHTQSLNSQLEGLKLSAQDRKRLALHRKTALYVLKRMHAEFVEMIEDLKLDRSLRKK